MRIVSQNNLDFSDLFSQSQASIYFKPKVQQNILVSEGNILVFLLLLCKKTEVNCTRFRGVQIRKGVAAF